MKLLSFLQTGSVSGKGFVSKQVRGVCGQGVPQEPPAVCAPTVCAPELSLEPGAPSPSPLGCSAQGEVLPFDIAFGHLRYLAYIWIWGDTHLKPRAPRVDITTAFCTLVGRSLNSAPSSLVFAHHL